MVNDARSQYIRRPDLRMQTLCDLPWGPPKHHFSEKKNCRCPAAAISRIQTNQRQGHSGTERTGPEQRPIPSAKSCPFPSWQGSKSPPRATSARLSDVSHDQTARKVSSVTASENSDLFGTKSKKDIKNGGYYPVAPPDMETKIRGIFISSNLSLTL